MLKVEVGNLRKFWIFFFSSSRAVLFLEDQKNICWALLDVEFHKLFNCILENALSLFFTEISWFKVRQWFLIALTSTVRTIPDVSVWLDKESP